MAFNKRHIDVLLTVERNMNIKRLLSVPKINVLTFLLLAAFGNRILIAKKLNLAYTKLFSKI